jgi:hypothetical protein
LGSIEERKQKEEKTDDDDGRSGSKDWNGRKVLDLDCVTG